MLPGTTTRRVFATVDYWLDQGLLMMFKVSDGHSKAHPTCIIVSILTAAVEHSHLIYPVETHDWFGYHTTILQDDEIHGASTMPNVACSAADPMFFMHHCNVDRLWAEWQDAGHYGSM